MPDVYAVTATLEQKEHFEIWGSRKNACRDALERVEERGCIADKSLDQMLLEIGTSGETLLTGDCENKPDITVLVRKKFVWR